MWCSSRTHKATYGYPFVEIFSSLTSRYPRDSIFSVDIALVHCIHIDTSSTRTAFVLVLYYVGVTCSWTQFVFDLHNNRIVRFHWGVLKHNRIQWIQIYSNRFVNVAICTHKHTLPIQCYTFLITLNSEVEKCYFNIHSKFSIHKNQLSFKHLPFWIY